jgi:ABC-type transport system involved in cytochrome c biogenesis permease subunit
MRNGVALPVVALIAAAILTIVVLASKGSGPLTELELGGVAGAMTLAIYAVQGLISVAIEGRELHPGRVQPRLTDPLSLAILVISLALLGVAAALAYGLTHDWTPSQLGGTAGAGCLLLALVVVVYKEAFVGDEASFDDREDGVPW